MIDDFDVFDAAGDSVLVADITFDQINVIGDLGEVVPFAGVEIVEDSNGLTLFQQETDKVASDKTGASGDQDVAHSILSL